MEQLAHRLGLEIRVCHDPPYQSKYNPVEPRCFPYVARACSGVIFDSVATALDVMAQTCTTRGLTTTIYLLQGDYPTGQTAPKHYKKTMGIIFDDILPKWNYRAIPVKEGS